MDKSLVVDDDDDDNDDNDNENKKIKQNPAVYVIDLDLWVRSSREIWSDLPKGTKLIT